MDAIESNKEREDLKLYYQNVERSAKEAKRLSDYIKRYIA